MTIFREREESYERKFAHDEELKFRAKARRNRLLGLWAAETLGKTGDDASTYALQVVAGGLEQSGSGESGDDQVLRMVASDLADQGITEQQVRDKMLDFLGLALQQIKEAR